NFSAGRLGDVLDHAVATALADGSADLRVLRDDATDDLRLSTDLDRLSQVFINLIANAEKYCTAEQPQLRIVAQESGDWLFIDFIDNGAGIPPEYRTTIFEKFSRVSPERAGGAGLGLAICREIMQRLGGDVGYLAGQEGGAFRVSLSLRREIAA
ncbi:MAG: ATP-binding protein, partial [Pseudomonadota bacterium]|nr:ATP-binding protein [Pseudomonadota bacterium]